MNELLQECDISRVIRSSTKMLEETCAISSKDVACRHITYQGPTRLETSVKYHMIHFKVTAALFCNYPPQFCFQVTDALFCLQTSHFQCNGKSNFPLHLLLVLTYRFLQLPFSHTSKIIFLFIFLLPPPP